MKGGKKRLTLTEYPDPNHVVNIWRHPDIYQHQVQEVKNYCDKVKNGKIEIKYVLHGKYGRYFAEDNKVKSSITMWGALRFHLFSEKEYDLDIVACHQSILFDLINNRDDYEVEYLEQYIKERDNIINSFSLSESAINQYNIEKKCYATKKDIIKSLFTILLYGGKKETWEDEFNLTISDYKAPDFLNPFIEELTTNIEVLLHDKRFTEIKKEVYELKKEKYKNKYGVKFDIEKLYIKNGEYLSVILQEYERQIIEECMTFLNDRNITITSYNYDGFQVLKESFEPNMLDDLNDNILKVKFGTTKKQYFKNIKLIIKPFKEGLDLSKIKPLKNYFNEEEYCLSEWYDYRKEVFEKYHFKCQDPFMYVKEIENDNLQFIKDTKILGTYKHLKAKMWCDVSHKFKMKCFMNKWLDDENMRCYRSIGFYPRPLICPENVYNAWKDFPIEKVELIEQEGREKGNLFNDTERIHKHFDNISNHNAELKEYLLNWFAHLVQYPAEKIRVCLVIQGLQGSGKSMLSEYLMKKIIGADKMFITGKTDKAFGKFSDLQGKLLCVLNEASGKDTFELNETLKDCITCDVLQLEKKGIDIIEVIDYVNYIFTTNNINAVKLTADDRRFMAFSVDNTIKNNKEYFTTLKKDLDNISLMRKFYEELMERDLSKWDAINDRPQTELMETMKEINEEPIDKFLNYYRENIINYSNDNNDDDDDEVGFIIDPKRIKADFLYRKFKVWWDEEGRKKDSMMTRTKFGAIIKTKVKWVKNGCIYYLFE